MRERASEQMREATRNDRSDRDRDRAQLLACLSLPAWVREWESECV